MPDNLGTAPWRYDVINADWTGPTDVLVVNEKSNATFRCGSLADAQTTIQANYSDS